MSLGFLHCAFETGTRLLFCRNQTIVPNMRKRSRRRVKVSQGSRSGRAFAVVLALLAGSSYGFGGAISQVVKSQGFELAHIVVGQFVAAVAILCVLAAIRFHPKMDKMEMLQLVGIGAISTISSYTYYLAIDMLSVGQAVALQFQYVWMAVVIQSIADRSKPGVRVVIASLLIIFGTVFGSGMADEIVAGELTMDPVGVACALVCALFYAVFIVLNGKVAVQHDPVSRTLFMALGGLCIALIALPFMSAGPSCDVIGLIPGGIAMGLVMTIIPVACIAAATSRISGGLVAILTSSELPMGIVAGCLLLGETTTPFKVFGIVVIVAAIVLSEFDPSKRAGNDMARGGKRETLSAPHEKDPHCECA